MEGKTLDPNDYSAVVKSRAGTLRPDFVNSIALKAVSREDAAAAGWSCYYVPQACRYGHTAARFVKNDLCVDCWRIKQKREPLYPKSRDRRYYDLTPAPAAPSAAPLTVAPAKPLEPSRREQDFLAALAMVGDFDSAAQSVGMTRGQVEARASVDEVFKKALTDLCERHSIPWTRAPDASSFKWTPEIERDLVKRFIDTGLIEQARIELGVPASDYQQHLQDAPRFSESIEAARPLARETLKERALHAADRGNDRLLKALEDDVDADFIQLTGGQRVRRLGNVEGMREEMTQLLTTMRRELGARERLREACISHAGTRKQPPADDSTIEVEE